MKNQKQRPWVMVFVLAGIALGWAAQAVAAEGPALSPKYEKWLNDEVSYIISAKEKDVFLKLGTDKERDVFIESFWKQRDPKPATPENEFKIQHYLRLQIADQTFGTPGVEGRKTPAGRLYIVTGEAKFPERILADQKKALAAAAQDSSPWIMKMRIYESAGKGGEEPAKTVTASYLNYSLTATIKTEFDLAEEMKQIQKTFNNPDVKLLTEADFSWKKNDREKAFHMFRLDGREYLVLITPVDVLRRLTFRIEVFEQGEKTKVNLLDTEFTIPEKNITIFGFEDSKNNAYFLSFRVSGWMPAPPSEPYVIPAEGPVRAIGEIKPPRLLKQVDPVYPEIARQANVEGIVILEAETDIYGRVVNTRVLRSIPLLDQAAVDVVKQWVYEPMIIGGRPRGMIFTVTVRFTLDGKGKETTSGVRGGVYGEIVGAPLKLTSATPPKLLKQVDPIYPEAARKARVEGAVILEATIDIYGRVQSYKILRSIPLLDQAAIDAVKQWVYEPAIVNGKPLPLSFTVTVEFTLDGKKGAAAGVSGGGVGGVLGGVVGGVMTTEEFHKLAAEGEKLGPVRAVGNLQPPRLIRQVDPIYPSDARAAGVEGTVILEAETDVYGRIKTAKPLRSIPVLDQAAIDAVKQWIYEPFMLDGKPRGVIFTVTVQFTLK